MGWSLHIQIKIPNSRYVVFHLMIDMKPDMNLIIDKPTSSRDLFAVDTCVLHKHADCHPNCAMLMTWNVCLGRAYRG